MINLLVRKLLRLFVIGVYLILTLVQEYDELLIPNHENIELYEVNEPFL